MPILRKIRSDVIYTGINYAFRLVLKPILLLAIPFFLSEIEQGYWYTFTSLAALTTFADLGFTTIVSQFAAHEAAMLYYEKKTRLYCGDVGRLSSLYATMKKWFGIAMMVATPIIFVVGYLVMGADTKFYEYIFGWLLYCIFNSVNFYIQTNLAFFEGCNRIADVQKIKSIDAIVFNCLSIAFLMLGAGIYSLGCSMAIACVIDIFLYKMTFSSLLNQFKECNKQKVQWFKEIMPLLKRYALGWISNYFTFQIYNPLTFRMFGAEVAGQVGYTMTIVSSIYSLANVWVYVVTPSLNAMAERKSWSEMDKTFRENVPLAAGTFVFGVTLFSFLVQIPFIDKMIDGRILPLGQLIILSIAYFFQVIINGMAVYLRAHKREPLLYVGIVSAIISICATVIILYLGGVDYIFEGYLCSFIFTMPTVLYIFRSRKKMWHTTQSVE